MITYMARAGITAQAQALCIKITSNLGLNFNAVLPFGSKKKPIWVHHAAAWAGEVRSTVYTDTDRGFCHKMATYSIFLNTVTAMNPY